MRNLLAGLLLCAAIAPSIPWGELNLPNWPVDPTPTPIPTPSPTPNPNPSTPLAKLVPDIHQRAHLVRFFDDLATLVERDTAGVITDVEQLRQANKASGHLLEQSGAIQPNPAFWTEVNRRQVADIGLDPGPLDPAKKAKIVSFYRSIAIDLAN